MEDKEIVGLFWERNEQAINESQNKYGSYCYTVSYNILEDRSDAEECVNDTWLKAWNAIPPNRPSVLATFLGKITRNLSFDRYKEKHREKRGGHNVDLVLDELEEIVSGKDDPEERYLRKELMREINRFLGKLPEKKRYMFIQRYWYGMTITKIAERFLVSENNATVTLSRIRKELKEYLEKKEYGI
ncbi:MAG: RNA polymerase sigma factor [Lachnospiraceae bacterium]|nr:RNA polymerase sigma factor [Lachnospiraceae bacterium]